MCDSISMAYRHINVILNILKQMLEVFCFCLPAESIKLLFTCSQPVHFSKYVKEEKRIYFSENFKSDDVLDQNSKINWFLKNICIFNINKSLKNNTKQN